MPIHKNSLYIRAFGCSFERAIKYHRWIGRWTFSTMTLHGFFEAFQSVIGILIK
jgi:hypothetical protein